MLPNRSLWVWRAPYVSAAVCEHDVVAGYVADAGREFLVREPVPAERVDREVQPSLREHKYGCQIRLNTQTRCSDYYRPQTKFAKVMFSHLSVSHSVHRGVSVQMGRSLSRGSLSWRLPPYGNERAVRILLECILVLTFVRSFVMSKYCLWTSWFLNYLSRWTGWNFRNKLTFSHLC